MACLAGASRHMHLPRRSLASMLFFSDLPSPTSFSTAEHMKVHWDEQRTPPSAQRSPRHHRHHHHHGPHPAPTDRMDPYVLNHRHLAHPHPHQLPLHIEDGQAMGEWGEGMSFVQRMSGLTLPPGAPHPFDGNWKVLSDLPPPPLSLIPSCGMFSAS